MTAPGAGQNGGEVPPAPSTARMVGIGCFMTWIGFFSGAMIGVLISKGVAFFMKAPKCDGIPTCDWGYYMLIGGAIGAVSLPLLVLSAMRRPKAPEAPNSDDKF